MHPTGNLFVVAIDFWQPSLNALTMAERFARQFDGRIMAVHVVEPNAHYPEGYEVDADTQVEDLQKLLDAMVQPVRDRGIHVETEVRHGQVTRQLTEVVHQLEADLLFVGLREGRILEDVFIGLHTLQLLKIGEVPILVVDSPPHDAEIRELMIPFDPAFGFEGSLEFLRALDQPLCNLAQLLVITPPKSDERAILEIANEAADALRALGIEKISVQLVHGEDIYRSMMDEIRASFGTFDLVLLEHHDHISRGEFTLGTLIEEVVTKVRMPVLCAVAQPKR